MTDPFPIIDGCKLPEPLRAVLRPGETVVDASGHTHRLPRFFYEVPTWTDAKNTRLTAHFTLAELMVVDCRESNLLLERFPHYVPCAVSVLARYLEEFRTRVDAPVQVTVNGGYRSPSHGRISTKSPHAWATAADIYRIGNESVDDEKSIERFGRIAAGIGQEVRVLHHDATGDHLHLDLGYLTVAPVGTDEA